MTLETLRLRSNIIQSIRHFFLNDGFLEVDTPILAERSIPEETIELFSTDLRWAADTRHQTMYLLPSPELYMKRLVAEGAGKVFQFSRSFRNDEDPGPLHEPEFLMLEWYSPDTDYLDSVDTTEGLLGSFGSRFGHQPIKPPISRMTVDAAFKQYADISLGECPDTAALYNAATKAGHTVPENGTWSDLFYLILVTHVEPNLPTDSPLILLDYPVQVPCLARPKTGTPWRERWELYLNGVEIANCYSELVDHIAVSELFKSQSTKYPSDMSFPDIYRSGHPRCSGVALGVDRLIMYLLGADSISEIMPFPRKRF